MSSYTELSSYSPVYLPPHDPLQQTVNRLHGELLGLFQVRQTSSNANGQVITFNGQWLHDAEVGYGEIERRFQAQGFTALLRRRKGEDFIIAVEGVAERGRTGNPLINVLLLLATIATTLAAGANLSGQSLVAALREGSPLALAGAMLSGLPFAIALLSILGVHELGHYVAARVHGVTATLPYFIPMPFGGLGTLGAFISLRSPLKNRKVLFDIGLAGPVAGFLVALPLLLVGLWLSPTAPYFMPGLTLQNAGSSILVDWMVSLFNPIPAGRTLAMHPIFFAAWFGLLITGINLLPVGQLDGGHVAYALFGRRAHTLALIVFVLLLLAGAVLSFNWYVWAFFVLLGGLRHPPPLNDVTPLNPERKLIGWLTVLLFFLITVPAPFATASLALLR